MKRITAVSFLALLAMLLGSGQAMAVSSYLTAFNTAYPGSTTGTNASCNLCHSSGGGSNINIYGRDWAAQHNGGLASAAAFHAIDGSNSDVDPTASSNLVEINANAQPGWTPGLHNNIYNLNSLALVSSNQNPPTITGNVLDPVVAPPVNQPPVLGAIGAKSVNEGVLLAFTATATDPNGNALTFTAGGLPTGATLSSGGAFSWTPTFAQAGNFNVTITVTDNGSPAMSDFEIVTITVGNVNRPPVLGAIAAAQSASVGVLKTIPITATDPDGNGLVIAGSNLPTGATVTDNLNGTATFSWTPSATQTGSFPNVTITATDNGVPSLTATTQFTVTVVNSNQPPVLAPIGAKTASVGVLLAFQATATDPNGNALTFSGGNLPTGAALTTAGAFSWTPAANQVGSFSVTITVTDNGVPPQNDTETFTITVGAVNQPPVLAPIGARTVNEGQALTFMATATDPDGNALTFTGTNLPAGATLSSAGAFSWTPGFTQAGTFSVTITVSDGALTDAETFTITVGNTNRPPVLAPSPIGARTITLGQTLTIALTASDADGDALTFAGASLPTGATLVPNGSGAATFSWTPAAGQEGTYPNVSIAVSDGSLSDAEVFTITVNAVAANHPPVVNNPGSKTVTEGQLLSFTITGTDPDGNTFTFASANLPTGATLSSSGAFSWTPIVGQAGGYSVTVTATDNGSPPLTSASATFMITVQPFVPSTGSISIKDAEWGEFRLEVQGNVSPGGVMVTIVNADTGRILGRTMAKSEGEWSVKFRTFPAPCRIQAKAGGKVSAIVAVKGAPRKCGARHDEDD